MKIIVSGATGFVGRHLVPELLSKGHEVIAVARDTKKAAALPWVGEVDFVACDVHAADFDTRCIPAGAHALVHLAWPGLPNYRDLFHFERNLPADYHFLKAMVESGIGQVLVTGTCFEYGMQSGPLGEEVSAQPANPYGLAKDTLRRYLEFLQKRLPFILQWVRLFYMHGVGQNPNSLIAQLDRAIDNGDSVFNMSGGEQLRDYLPIEVVAHRLAWLAEHSECQGVINCCSGRPVSVRRLVEERIKQRGANITLNLGYYPYPDYEPMAFWGDGTKLIKCMGTSDETESI